MTGIATRRGFWGFWFEWFAGRAKDSDYAIEWKYGMAFMLAVVSRHH